MTEIRVSQVVAEVLTQNPSTLRVSQVVVEALTQNPGVLKVSQIVAEVIVGIEEESEPVVSRSRAFLLG